MAAVDLTMIRYRGELRVLGRNLAVSLLLDKAAKRDARALDIKVPEHSLRYSAIPKHGALGDLLSAKASDSC